MSQPPTFLYPLYSGTNRSVTTLSSHLLHGQPLLIEFGHFFEGSCMRISGRKGWKPKHSGFPSVPFVSQWCSPMAKKIGNPCISSTPSWLMSSFKEAGISKVLTALGTTLLARAVKTVLALYEVAQVMVTAEAMRNSECFPSVSSWIQHSERQSHHSST